MPTVALQAHFDGEHIVLDEKFDLPANTRLMVTLLPASLQLDSDSEEIWLRAVASSSAFAFLADPAENIYSPEDGEPFNDALVCWLARRNPAISC